MAKPRDNLVALHEAFGKLTYREMTEVSECLCEALDAQKGLKVKPEVMSEALDSLGAFLEIEVEQTD